MKRLRPFLVDTLRSATAVREPVRFCLAQLLGGGERVYTLRSGPRIVVRHRSRDVAILAEMFSRNIYDLAGGGQRTVLDLGANIGLFTALAVSRLPDASVLCYEPDPDNARVLRRMVALNGLEGRVRIVEACAGVREGSVRFSAGHHSDSKISDSGELSVPMEDVLPLDADLIKIDIEGAEWELLRDPRFADTRAQNMLLEWHSSGGGDEPEARAALASAGFDVVRAVGHSGNGTISARRSTPPPGAD